MIEVLWAETDAGDNPSRLARLMLADLGVPEVTQKCRDCGGPHGQPTAPNCFVSIAHAAGAVVVARSHRPVGIDVEGANADPLWTRTEAVLKADGRGLRVDPDDVEWRGDRARVEGRGIHYRVIDLDVDPKLRVSVAAAEARVGITTSRRARRAVRVRRWPLAP